MNKKILILGKGFIGSRLREELKCAITNKKIYSFYDAERIIKKHKPKILINCIGYTGKTRVDDCEIDKDKTLMAYTFVPILLAETALRNKIKFVQISSGCIYNYDYSFNRPIKEEEKPDYFNLFYSRSKIYSERALEIMCNNYDILIVRLRVPLDDRPHHKNLLTKIIEYKKVIDIPNSVTYIPDFLKALKHLIRIDARGIYNVVNSGGLRYGALLKVYKKYAPLFEYEITDLKKLKLRRTNLILSTKKLENTGFKVRNVYEVLEECVRNYIKF